MTDARNPTQPTSGNDHLATLVAQLVDSQNRTLALLEGKQRVDGDQQGVKLQAADLARREQQIALHEAKGPEQRVRLRLVCELGDEGEREDVEVTALCFKVAPGEEARKGDRGSPVGKLRIQALDGQSWDDAAAVARLRADLHERVKDTIESLRMSGQQSELAKMLESLEQPSGIGASGPGTKHLRWSKVTQPTMRKLIGRCVEDMVSAGIARVVEAPAK